jgi:hypothetical protein
MLILFLDIAQQCGKGTDGDCVMLKIENNEVIWKRLIKNSIFNLNIR